MGGGVRWTKGTLLNGPGRVFIGDGESIEELLAISNPDRSKWFLLKFKIYIPMQRYCSDSLLFDWNTGVFLLPKWFVVRATNFLLNMVIFCRPDGPESENGRSTFIGLGTVGSTKYNHVK